MGSPTTIHPFPELRALAEEEADALHRVLFGRPTDGSRLAQWREAHLTLLCDLTRPASRDAVCRLVAGRIGRTPATVVLAVETTGVIRARLHRDCGVPAGAPTSGSAAEALALIVRHLWPEEAPRE